MKQRIFARVKEKSQIEAGFILIAKPFWDEEIYKQVVVLIIEHNSGGTTGILLNRMSTLSVAEAIPPLKLTKPLYFGGSFETKIISYIHNNISIPDSIYLGNNLFWGGNFDKVSEMIFDRTINLDEINFYAGFVHWSPGQLEDELTKSKWWIHELNDYDLFTSEDLWGESLESLGNMYSLFKNIPDPSIS